MTKCYQRSFDSNRVAVLLDVSVAAEKLTTECTPSDADHMADEEGVRARRDSNSRPPGSKSITHKQLDVWWLDEEIGKQHIADPNFCV